MIDYWNTLFAQLRNAHYSPVVWSWCTRYWQIAGCKKIILDVTALNLISNNKCNPISKKGDIFEEILSKHWLQKKRAVRIISLKMGCRFHHLSYQAHYHFWMPPCAMCNWLRSFFFKWLITFTRLNYLYDSQFFWVIWNFWMQ